MGKLTIIFKRKPQTRQEMIAEWLASDKEVEANFIITVKQGKDESTGESAKQFILTKEIKKDGKAKNKESR